MNSGLEKSLFMIVSPKKETEAQGDSKACSAPTAEKHLVSMVSTHACAQ